MGKKTNWSPAEDLALCRAWLAAGDAVGHSAGYSRAATFWGVAHHIFHAELETAVERGHNGLKIRWTRINRDVQKFATIVQELQDQHRSSNNTTGGNSEDGEDDEQQRVEDAKERFFKQYDGKFHFEACWKLLRLSPKWTQLLASAASTELPERGPTQQLQEVTSCLVDEMRRRNELLEEQNAIALFRLKTDEIEDEAREYFELLRRRYMKRMRAAVERSNSSSVQSRSGTRIETSSAAPAAAEDDSLTASEGEGEDVSKRVPQTHDLQQQGRESADGGAQTATSAV